MQSKAKRNNQRNRSQGICAVSSSDMNSIITMLNLFNKRHDEEIQERIES